MTLDQPHLKQKHTFLDFLYTIMASAIPFLLGCIAIAKVSVFMVVVYIVLGLAMVVIIYRFYCTHCPHYTGADKTVKCMFFWGLPKFFSPTPGPLTGLEKAITFSAAIALFIFPIYWFMAQPMLLIIYLLSSAVLVMGIRKNECSRCIYFDCPANNVPETEKSQPV